MIREASVDDAPELATIYNHFIAETVITFEEELVDAPEMAARIANTLRSGFPFFVHETAGRIAGYAYVGPWRTRTAYRYVVEAAVYLRPDCFGQGLGTELYTRLIAECRQLGLRAVMGMITLPNPASVRLHERLGFLQAAHYPAVGWKFERWLDVGCWQLDLAQPGENETKEKTEETGVDT